MSRSEDAPSLAYADTGRFRRLVRRTAGTPPLIWLYSRIQEPTDRLIYRISRGRATVSSLLSGLPVVMLTTTGARSGLRRTLPVLAIPDGDAIILIASNFGRPRNPAWYHNLRAHRRATITAGRVTREVQARELTGEEREVSFRRGVELYPPFLAYRGRAPTRQIPVLRLVPLEEPRLR